MARPRYEQSPVAKGLIQADQATGLAGELVIPAMIGWGVDYVFGLTPFGLIAGAVLGFVLMMTHLFQMVSRANASQARRNAADRPAVERSEPDTSGDDPS